jgi:hypothetical protein
MEIGEKIVHSFLTNRYLYSTNQTEEQIREQFKALTKSVGFFEDYRYNLTGEVSRDNFKLHRRAGLMLIRSWDRQPVTIYGEIIRNEQNLIDFDVEIKPNFVFLMSIILTTITPIGYFFYNLSNGKVDISPVLTCFLFAIIVWLGAHFTVAYYKEEFEKAFDLEPASAPISSRIRF